MKIIATLVIPNKFLIVMFVQLIIIVKLASIPLLPIMQQDSVYVQAKQPYIRIFLLLNAFNVN